MRLWLAVGWAAFCVGCFLVQRPISFGTDRIPPFPSFSMLTPHFATHAGLNLLRVTLFWMAAWRAGSWLRRSLRFNGLSGSEGFLPELGLGAGVLGLAAFALGLLGVLNAIALVAALAALAFAALPALYAVSRGANPRALTTAALSLLSSDTAIPTLFLLLAAAYQFLVALGPTVFYDSLVYHLGLPDLYLRRGAFVPTPLNVYGGIPAGVEMLYLWLLPLGGLGTPAQLLHFTLGLLTAGTIVVIGKRFDRLETGLWAAAVFLLNPMVMLEMGRPAVELGWSFYLALSLLALMTTTSAEDRPGHVLAGLLAGFALGTKYQAALLLPAAAAFILQRYGRREGWKPLVVFGLTAVATAAPWGMKNIFFYDNPVFPMFGGTLFPAGAHIDLPAFLSSAHARSLADLRGFLFHLWTCAMPRETSEADGIMSLAALILLPVVLASRQPDWAKRFLLVAAVLWIPMNLVSGLARFSIPALVPLSLALVAPLGMLSGTARRVRDAGAVVVFALCGLYVHSKTDALLWSVLNGSIPAPTFLSHQRPTYPAPAFPAYQWANERLPPDAKLLLVGEPRGFYLDRDHETSSPYANQPLAVYAESATSGKDLRARLKAVGFTHILLNVSGMSLSRQGMSLSAAGLAAAREFWTRGLSAEFVDNSDDPRDRRFTVVYRILTEDESNRAHPPVQFPFDVK